ncbi:MAG: nicotinate-nucleotide adenylyltransferase [bacterium]
MNIGIFGGTFNPIHHGHLIVAEQIREGFGLHRIYFIPSANPPHKEGPIVDGRDRLAMVESAIDSNPSFYSSSREVTRGGSSYTIDTVLETRRDLGEGHTFAFILGSDAFQDIRTWKDYRRLLKLCTFIVISRPGADIERVRGVLTPFLTGPELNLRIQQVSADEIATSIDIRHADIYFVSLPHIDISSSTIRFMFSQGKSIRYQVPDTVLAYIISHKLYGVRS